MAQNITDTTRGDGEDLPKWLERSLTEAGIDLKRIVAWEAKSRGIVGESVKLDITIKMQPTNPEEIKIDLFVPPSELDKP